MPALRILRDVNIGSYEELDVLLQSLVLDSCVTSTQYRVAKDLLRSRIPGRVTVKQRTPKSVILFETDTGAVRVNNRGKVSLLLVAGMPVS
jgi:hypothetical protein